MSIEEHNFLIGNRITVKIDHEFVLCIFFFVLNKWQFISVINVIKIKKKILFAHRSFRLFE